MAIYKVLYWRNIPTQIRAEDDDEDVTLELDERFMRQVDIVATRLGLQEADTYLAQWKWGDEVERSGSARETAQAVKAELEARGFQESSPECL